MLVFQIRVVEPKDIDAARLPDLMAGYLDQLKKPALIVAYAFDVMPPQTREFLSHFQCRECAPEPITGTSVRAAVKSFCSLRS